MRMEELNAKIEELKEEKRKLEEQARRERPKEKWGVAGFKSGRVAEGKIGSSSWDSNLPPTIEWIRYNCAVVNKEEIENWFAQNGMKEKVQEDRGSSLQYYVIDGWLCSNGGGRIIYDGLPAKLTDEEQEKFAKGEVIERLVAQYMRE